ncbi:MAG: hypothetical protein V4507_08000 [Verrucomicrobiota bacterium]
MAEEQRQEAEKRDAGSKEEPKTESPENGTSVPSVDSTAPESKETPK